jgi:hypothetical protein
MWIEIHSAGRVGEGEVRRLFSGFAISVIFRGYLREINADEVGWNSPSSA